MTLERVCYVEKSVMVFRCESCMGVIVSWRFGVGLPSVPVSDC